jgi:hypothetical protein
LLPGGGTLSEKIDKDLLNLQTQVNGIKLIAPLATNTSVSLAPAPSQTVSFAVPNIAQPAPQCPHSSILTAPVISISGTTSSISHLAKNAAPSKFSGNTDKIHFDTWINQLQLYLLATNTTSDQDKVMTAMGFIEGNAMEQMRDYWGNMITTQTCHTWKT